MSSTIESISLPNNVDAERAILGAIILDNDAHRESIVKLFERDFYLEEHRRIYKTMSRMFEQGMIVDQLTLIARLRQLKQLEAAGGEEYISSITVGLPPRISIEAYIQIVKDKSLLRQIVQATTTAAYQASDDSDAPLEVLNSLDSSLRAITERGVSTGYSRINEIVIDSFGSIDKLYESGREITGLATQYREFDQMTRGLQPSDLIVIAARPSMGKTAWAINIAQKVATNSKKSVLVFSLEMSKAALLRRMLSSQAMIDLHKIQTGLLKPNERAELTYALEELVDSYIHIDDTPSISLQEMRAKASRLKRSEYGLDLIVVDYLQLMSATTFGSKNHYENRTQEVSAISRGLKALAKELNVPVVALSQLSRANEQRHDKRPFLSDLRESGSIEQDADVVVFIHREAYYKRLEDGREDPELAAQAEVIIAKQRNGPVGTVKLTYLANYTAFENLDMRLLANNTAA